MHSSSSSAVSFIAAAPVLKDVARLVVDTIWSSKEKQQQQQLASIVEPETVEIRNWILKRGLEMVGGDEGEERKNRQSKASIVEWLQYCETASIAAAKAASGDNSLREVREAASRGDLDALQVRVFETMSAAVPEKLPEIREFEFDVLKAISFSIILGLVIIIASGTAYEFDKAHIIFIIILIIPIALLIVVMTQVVVSTFRIHILPPSTPTSPRKMHRAAEFVQLLDACKGEGTSCKMIAVIRGDELSMLESDNYDDVEKQLNSLVIVHERKSNPNAIATAIFGGLVYLVAISAVSGLRTKLGE